MTTQQKPFWTSKTLWVNLIAIIAMIVQDKTGFVIPPEEQLTILGMINLILRAITKETLTWK